MPCRGPCGWRAGDPPLPPWSGSSTTAPTPRSAGTCRPAPRRHPRRRGCSCATTRTPRSTWRRTIPPSRGACATPPADPSAGRAQRRFRQCRASPPSTKVHRQRRSFLRRHRGHQGLRHRLEARRRRSVTWQGCACARCCAGLAASRRRVGGFRPRRRLRRHGENLAGCASRSPINKALDDALLAWGQREPLLPDHGFPLRLSAWVGIASINRVALRSRPPS